MTIETQQKDLLYWLQNKFFMFREYLYCLERGDEVHRHYVEEMGVFTIEDCKKVCEWDKTYFASMSREVYAYDFTYKVPLKCPEELNDYLEMSAWELPQPTQDEKFYFSPEWHIDDERATVEPEVSFELTNFRLKESEYGQK